MEDQPDTRSDVEAGASAPDAPTDWRRDGRCSACRFFVTDYGAPPVLHGHCKLKPRRGGVESTNYACDQYRPLEGFAELTGSTSFDRSLTAGSGASTPQGRAAGRSRARPPVRVSRGPRVIRRRQGDDGTLHVREGRASPDLPAAAAATLSQAFAALVPAQGSATPTPTPSGEDGVPAPGGAPAMDPRTLRETLIDVIENFLGIEDVELADKWQGGRVLIEPGNPELKPHEIPVDALFHKIVMVRDRLRVLEQKINTQPKLDDADKVELQQYISRCYGSLTTFNVLFKDKRDRFSSK